MICFLLIKHDRDHLQFSFLSHMTSCNKVTKLTCIIPHEGAYQLIANVLLSSNWVFFPACLGLKRTSYKGVVLCAAESNSEANLKFSEEVKVCVDEPFRGKSGSVSFQGSTHQLVEEGKPVSSPSLEGTSHSKERIGSLLWMLAPVALISSIVLPQLLLSTVIDAFIKDEILLGKKISV